MRTAFQRYAMIGFFPSDPLELRALICSFADGWTDFGLGNPQPYPTFFPLAPLLLAVQSVTTPTATLALIIAGTLVLAARSAAAIGRAANVALSGRAALALVAVLNPWVYTQYVAGHIFMVTAYAILLALLAELQRPQPRTAVLCVIAAGLIVQIEFFVVAAVPFLLWCGRRRAFAPALICVAFATPILLGIAGNYEWLRATPHGLDWEIWASVPLRYGALMIGYGRNYAGAFSPLWFASASILVLAVGGAVFAVRRTVERTAIIIGILSWCFASGYADGFALVYRFLIVTFPETSVFRELYDLIGFVAIATVVGLARACNLHVGIRIAALAATLSLAIPWIVQPVASWSVPLAAIPHPVRLGSNDQRLLLLPAFQPLRFGQRGSGTDPDIFPSTAHATPLNEWMPSFPVTSALGFATRDGDLSFARALGAQQIIARPYLGTDNATLAGQGVQLAPHDDAARSANGSGVPMPLAGLYAQSPIVSATGADPRRNDIFFGDRMPERIERFEPSNATHDPNLAWVDARGTVPGVPENGSAFGGVWTTSTRALPLPVRSQSATHILARVHGELLEDGTRRSIAKSTPQARWWPLTPQTQAIVCHGSCVVFLVGNPPQSVLTQSLAPTPVRMPRALQLRTLTPWLARVTISAHESGTLRYNVRYDAHWLALSDFQALPHMRLDTAVNGWTVAASPTSRTLLLIDWLAFAQAVLEGCAFATLAICLMQIRSQSHPNRPTVTTP